MTGKIKWAIIGSGGIARRRTIPEGFGPASNAHLLAVYGTNAATNKEVARQAGALACDSLEDLLRSEAEAVYVASPVAAHLSQVQACARAGKHVLCEKPLGRTVDEAGEIVAACAAAGVQLGVAFMMRFQAQHQAALKLIQEGKLGKPVYARAQLSFWYPPIPGAWRQDPASGGGGALMDLAGHCIDLLEIFFGPVQSVNCMTNRTIHSYASEDSALTSLKFRNGALGSVDTFFCIQDDGCKNVLELYGSNGSILASGTIGQASAGQMRAYLQSDEAQYNAQQPGSAAQGVPISPEPQNIYRAEVEAFGQALLDDRPNPMPGEDGLRSQRILAACYKSAATDGTVAL